MLEGKITLVTGASRGIGRQVALALGREGASAVVNYNGSAAKIEEAVEEIEATGGKAEVVQCNVSDFGSCDRMMVDVVPRYGHLDILMNDAGIVRGNLLVKILGEDFDAVISTNLEGVFSCIERISHRMLKQRAGRIINISSVSRILSNAGQADYCAVKAGITGVTKSVVRGLASRGITVNTVAPGLIATKVIDALNDSAKVAATEQIPMRHFGSAQGITEVVVSLVSDKTGYITGQVLSVDGGMTMQDDLERFPG